MAMADDRPSMASRFLESYSARSAGGDVTVRRHERLLLATWNVLLLVDRSGSPKRSRELDMAAAGAFELMESLEAELSRFVPESEVSLMNAIAATRPVPVSATLAELLEASRRAWEVTRGAFDPTVGPLMQAWGFWGGGARVPDDDEIEQLLRCRGMDLIELDGETGLVSFARPGVSFDPGAIGKGLIVDRLVAHLRAAGVEDGAVLSGRSTLVVWGSAPDGGPWRVGVANPRSPDEPLLELRVAPGAVSTSAAYERRVSVEGVDYGHVIDPRTGRPSSRSLGVTVWTPNSMSGDVASTALFVLGREEGEEILGDLAPISAIFLEADSSSWGGIRAVERHAVAGGTPGFEIV